MIINRKLNKFLLEFEYKGRFNCVGQIILFWANGGSEKCNQKDVYEESK